MAPEITAFPPQPITRNQRTTLITLVPGHWGIFLLFGPVNFGGLICVEVQSIAHEKLGVSTRSRGLRTGRWERRPPKGA